jgi:hypothetical protein
VIIGAIRDLSSELAAAPALHAQLNIEVPGYLSVKAIPDRANPLIQNRGSNQMSPKGVGGIVRSMGFKPQKAQDGYRFSPDPLYTYTNYLARSPRGLFAYSYVFRPRSTQHSHVHNVHTRRSRRRRSENSSGTVRKG